MNINLTLLIQIGNIGLAYVVLRYLLFDPVMNVIAHEESNLEKYRKDIMNAQKSIDAREIEISVLKQECYDFCDKHKPSEDQIQPAILEDIAPKYEIKRSTEEEIEACAQHISVEVSKRIEHI